MTTSQDGAAFENYVASLYEGLGCKVQRNLLLSGQQVDLLVRRTFPGMGTITSIVECKFLRNAAVSNQHIYDFNHFFLSCRELHRINNAVVVTNSRFSKEATSFAHDHPFLLLKTSMDLEKEILNVSEALLLETREYRNAAIFDNFIHLRGEGRLFPRKRPCTISDVYGAICQWLLGGEAGFVTLLGDFGSGKTTILERVRFFCSERYLQNNAFYIPILFKLRNLRYYRTLPEFISHTIIEHFNHPLPTTLFFEYLRNRKFLLLLDGFDEISTVANRQTRASSFYELLPLYGSASPAIMTCRPTYFVSPSELKRLLGRLAAKDKSFAKVNHPTAVYSKLYDKYTGDRPLDLHPRDYGATISLHTLSDTHIDEYLQKHAAAFTSALHVSWDNVRDFLFKIYDIHDLMKRPILLSMIVDTVLEGEMDIEANDIKHGPASLYELYTNINFDRDWKKSSHTAYLTPQQRRQFAHYIALTMLRSPTLEVSSDDINNMLQGIGTSMNVVNSRGPLSIEQVATDLRVCAFLKVLPSNMFRFTHRSFMEFFVAQYIALELLSGRLPGILGYPLTTEIVYFLGNLCLCSNYKNLATSIEHMRSKQECDGEFYDNVQSNLGGAILHAGDLSVGAAFFRTKWKDYVFKKLKWQKHVFVDCNFDKSSFEGVSIAGARFRNVLHQATEFKECRVERCEWRGKVFNTTFDRTEFLDSEIHVDSERSSIRECTFNKCRVYVAGSLFVVSSQVDRTHVVLEQWKRTKVYFQRVHVRNSEIAVEELAVGVEVIFEDVLWEAAIVYGVFVPMDKLLKIIDHGALRGCEGLILTNEGVDKIADADGVMKVGGVFVMPHKLLVDKEMRVKYIERIRERGAGTNIINRLEWWSRRASG